MADIVKQNTKRLATRFKPRTVVVVRVVLFFSTCCDLRIATNSNQPRSSVEYNYSTETSLPRSNSFSCRKQGSVSNSSLEALSYTIVPEARQSTPNVDSRRHKHEVARSKIDISQCVISNSSLNITVQDGIAISYLQHDVHLLNYFRTDTNSSPASSDNGYNQDVSRTQQGNDVPISGTARDKSHSQRKTDSTKTTTAGHCSLLIKAPPGTILSILFLNQTCSRENEVRIEDIHPRGGRTALNGCSPWKAPGYDATTSSESAVVVVDLHDLVQFYRLDVHVAATCPPVDGGLLTRYVNPSLCFLQTLGWHPFAMVSSTENDGVSAILVPTAHSTLISVVYARMHVANMTHVTSASLLKLTSQRRHQPQKVWSISPNSMSRPDVRLLNDVAQLQLRVKKVSGAFFGGIRILFSFHQPWLAPQRNSSSLLWNCSVSNWPDFEQHLLCNSKPECAEREDEMWCPDTTCPEGGIQMDTTCYFFLHLPKGKMWHYARNACRNNGTALASFSTATSWYHFALLVQTKTPTDCIYIGLRSTDDTSRHMYRYLHQWVSGVVAYFYHYNVVMLPPACGYFWFNRLYLLRCGEAVPHRNVYALCQKSFTTRGSVGKGRSSSYAAESHTKSDHVPENPQLTTYASSRKNLLLISTVECPSKHRIHEFLKCDDQSACWSGHDVRSGDAAADKKAVVDCTNEDAMFPCKNGANLVPYSLVCDHLQNCPDYSDEKFCVFPPCSAADQYKCPNEQCIHFRNRCDGLVQCVDESDEKDCPLEVVFLDREQPLPPLLVGFDGRGFVRVQTVTHEARGATVVCPGTHIYCSSDDACLPVFVRCNEVVDCTNREDEVGCESYNCPGFYRCYGPSGQCLHPDNLCDGWAQCPQHDDEQFCNRTCPDKCTCSGHAFTCTGVFQVSQFSDLRYLDADGSGLLPELLARNNMLIYLRLRGCRLASLGIPVLPNLVSLDLSDNLLQYVNTSELYWLNNLQNLSLARNPLSGLFCGNLSSGTKLVNVLHVDLTGVQLQSVDVRRCLPFPGLLSLNLSKTGVTRLYGDGFVSMTSVEALDLRGCPIMEFPRSIFNGLQELRRVFADNYRLCCQATLPAGFNVNNCRAPFSELSSCDALLRTDLYRVCLSILAALALSGNLGCFCLRVFAAAGRSKTGFNVFVTHLCVSDFVMGAYLLVIGLADRLYLGRYLWEDARWRQSAACQVAGALAFLSSEVSAFIICVITLDRFLVIRFPFSRLRFSPLSAQMASLLTWAVGVTLVVVPLLPGTSYWEFYGQTGICIPLPVTTKDFHGHDYVFGVMIVLNLVVFLVIAVGQISVYLSMTSNAMSSIDTTRKSRDLIVARRLVTVVASDFLCWFPLGLLGVLAAQEVRIPGEVNVGIAVFVLPLNSALNPFLYTLNMIHEKRRRATEKKLLKVIIECGISGSR